MRVLLICAAVFVSAFGVMAQEGAPGERRAPLTDTAVAIDSSGASLLEATLKTTVLNGAEDSPVTNILLVIKNSSTVSYGFISGLVTFYDGAGVRCGEGLFKADVLAVGEAFETDTPGIRIRCAPTAWRIIATSLVPRVAPGIPISAFTPASRSGLNLLISVDGEEHPIQLDKPMVLTLGESKRTIVVREAP